MTDLDPVRRPGEFVFAETDDATGAEASVREDEGLTVVRVDSTLEQVGLTEAVGLLRELRF